ncbi:hypothetical protein PR048_010101 [Dryococelus australis]|uniref:Uncharacterized protein n=1 Tax=Dryococelus australis TaxID=614101 RepID=A0ABQ9I1W1_9NEOP|nr:hypothetical protein PR048_010101 [Dryococelus australis]
MEKEHKHLKRQRAVYKGSMSRMQSFVSTGSESRNSCELKSRLDELPTLWARFNEVQLIIELDDEDTEHSEHRAEFETMFHQVKVQLEMLWTKRNAGNETTNGKQLLTPDHSYLHLPAVNLPTFTADFTTWVQFRDTFKGLIVNNKSLPDLQKLHYLISSSNDDAHELLCQALELIQSNQGSQFSTPANTTTDLKARQVSPFKHAHTFVATNGNQCPFCDENHSLYRCDLFAQASVDQRYEYVVHYNL